MVDVDRLHKTISIRKDVAEHIDKNPKMFNFSEWVENKYVDDVMSKPQDTTRSKEDILALYTKDELRVITRRQYVGLPNEKYRDMIDCWLAFNKQSVFSRWQHDTRNYLITFEEFSELMNVFADERRREWRIQNGLEKE